MNDEEKLVLSEHTKKLLEAKIAVTEAEAVLETLQEESIVATDLDLNLIPLDETREEKEERMLNEKTLSDVNDFF